jgi:putative endonuclease
MTQQRVIELSSLPMEPISHVYIMTSARNGTPYTGVTTHLARRVWEHREGIVEGFTKRYGVNRLVWFEEHATIIEAISREKQIKRWRRHGKSRS